MKKALLALLAAATVAPALVACDGTNLTTTTQTAHVTQVTQVVDYGIGNGNATYQKEGGELQEFTYTVNRNSMEAWDSQFVVTWNDGLQTTYRFITPGMGEWSTTNTVVQIIDHVDGVPNWKDANIDDNKVEFNGKDVKITTEAGTVTVLGGFAAQLETRLNDRAQWEKDQIAAEARAEQARQAEEARLNRETFDETISRWSKQLCRSAETLNYITRNSIINEFNRQLGNGEFKAGSKFWTRWNAMNSGVRTQHLLNAMNWDCNNVMMESLSNTPLWQY